MDRDVVFQFHPGWLSRCQELIPELTIVNALLDRASRGLEFDVATTQAAREPLLAIGRASGLQRLQRIIELFEILSRADPASTRLLASPWAPRPIAADSADIIDQVMTFIISADNVSLSAAAQLVGMSESALSRYVSRTVGHSFSETVRRMRMARACQLLTGTSLPVAGIAARSGYQNLSNFNRQFQASFAQTPTEFRRSAASDRARSSGNLSLIHI